MNITGKWIHIGPANLYFSAGIFYVVFFNQVFGEWRNKKYDYYDEQKEDDGNYKQFFFQEWWTFLVDINSIQRN